MQVGPAANGRPRGGESHHIDRWADGGRTDLRRGILLCRHHHLKLHNEGWRIRLDDERYWLEPPPQSARPPVELATKSRAMRQHLARRGGVSRGRDAQAPPVVIGSAGPPHGPCPADAEHPPSKIER